LKNIEQVFGMMEILIAVGVLFVASWVYVVWTTQRLNVDPLQDRLSPLLGELISEAFSETAERRFSQLAAALFAKYGLSRAGDHVVRGRLYHALTTLHRMVSPEEFRRAEKYVLAWNWPDTIDAEFRLDRNPVSQTNSVRANKDGLADIFISYAHEDRAIAGLLSARFEGAGYSVWWDDGIHAGSDWREALTKQLEGCKALVVLWSPLSAASEWVHREAAFAMERGKLVPAVVRRCRLPSSFSGVQACDLVEWDGNSDHVGWSKLKTAVGDIVKGRHD
jgi:hypothetical protein